MRAVAKVAPLWVCKDGRSLPVAQMTDSHLINAVMKVEREQWRLHWLPLLVDELKKRGLL